MSACRIAAWAVRGFHSERVAMLLENSLSKRRLTTNESLDEDNVSTPQLAELVLLLALKDLASEVRFEPREEDYRVTYKCGGRDYEMVPPPRELAGRISQVFKIFAELDIRNRRTPQQGRFRSSPTTRGLTSPFRFAPRRSAKRSTC
jgi:type II secretory ATPase GspE/PulE/Tfp pilus assembly ATPase PilB-like protein